MTAKERVRALLLQGLSYKEIEAQTGLTRSTICYHAKQLGLPRRKPGGVKLHYDWAAIQAYYDAGHSVRDCCEHFGFTLATWTKSVNAGRVEARHWEEEFYARLLPDERLTRAHVKRHLMDAGHLVNACAFCGINTWRGQPLLLELDHVNGERSDWRLENLRLLCPNCHSQTDTYGGKNYKRRRAQAAGRLEEARVVYRVGALQERPGSGRRPEPGRCLLCYGQYARPSTLALSSQATK